MSMQFPTRYQDVQLWANQEGVPIFEAGRRYIQYLILLAIGQSNPLRESLVFKGGNALEFVYHSNRSTIDLDFSFLPPERNLAFLSDTVKTQLELTLNAVDDGFGTMLKLQSINQNPPGAHMTHPTLIAKVAYTLPDQIRQRERLKAGNPGANVIPVEMSVNEVVCNWQSIAIGDSRREIHVATVEDIVAEKLRAILQQPVRNRHRGQDILDIAVLRNNSSLNIDIALVSEYLLLKSDSRGIVVTKSAFHIPEISHRGAANFSSLSDTVRYTFIPFDEAWSLVLRLVEILGIPD